MINLAHVHAFLAVIDTGSFRGASQRLGLAQPTVSLQVRRLEAALGTALVHRSNRKCLPTPQGAAFVACARGLLATTTNIRDRLLGRQVVLGAASNIGIYLLPRHVRQLQGDGAAVQRIELIIGSNPDLVDKLEVGELDLAVMEWWDDRPGFLARPWRSERLVVIVPPEHAWATREQITLDELSTTPLLGGERGTGTGALLRRVLGDQATRLTVDQNLGSTEAVKRAVMAGLGVSLVSQSAVADERAAGRLHTLDLQDADLTKQLFIVLPRDLPPNAPAVRLAEQLLDS